MRRELQTLGLLLEGLQLGRFQRAGSCLERERERNKVQLRKSLLLVCLFVCFQPSRLLTEEEEVSALGGAVGQQGGVLGQQAVRAGLVVFAIVV